MNEINILHKRHYRIQPCKRKVEMSITPKSTLPHPGFSVRVLMAVALIALTGCTDVPIKKTNCWSAAAASNTVSRNETDLTDVSFVPNTQAAKHDSFCE